MRLRRVGATSHSAPAHLNGTLRNGASEPSAERSAHASVASAAFSVADGRITASAFAGSGR